MKVIIAGPRNFPGTLDDLKKVIKEARLHMAFRIEEVVSGKATGVDALGEQYAKEKNKLLKTFPADWSIGPSAGPIRNNKMVAYAGGAIIVWDKESRGTKHCMESAIRSKLKVFVKTYSIHEGVVVFDPGFIGYDMGKQVR